MFVIGKLKQHSRSIVFLSFFFDDLHRITDFESINRFEQSQYRLIEIKCCRARLFVAEFMVSEL